MKVNGTVLLTRKALVTERFGAEAWHGLFRDLASNHPCFRKPITAADMVPLPEFLAFHDELVRRFYPERKQALLSLGAEAARWAHTQGPLKKFVESFDLTSLVDTMPKLWPRYFGETDSHSEAELRDEGVEFRVRDLPAWHPYFEHLVVGYMKEMLELYCANPVRTRRLTGGRGREYAYLLMTDPIDGGELQAPETSSGLESRGKSGNRRVAPSLPVTCRELEVLKLVGVGKTNREIAFLLGIAVKTVEHHVAHAYDKLGLYSRAGVAAWLAELEPRR